MRAGLYARVSREEQADGYSIDAQLDAMREFCAARGWTIAGEYVEPGASGTTGDRPALQEVLCAAEQGDLDVLLTHQLDRFYRNLRGQLETLGRLGEWGVGYLSTTEQIDYSTPQGMLFLSMLGAFNEYYAANLARETAKGKRARARAGRSNARPPHGYTRNADGQDVPDDNAPAIRHLFEEYATGKHTDQSLADHMNASGYPVPKGTAGRWNKTGVRWMLRNRFYLGEVGYKGQWFPGWHEAIVSQELFDQCWQVREAKPQGSRYKATKHDRLLVGLLYCHACGSKLWIVSRHYRDSAQYKGVACPHAHRTIRIDVIDEQVNALVRRLRLPDDWRERLQELANHDEEREQVDGKRKYLTGKLRRLRDLYVEGDFDKAEYDRRKAEHQGQLDGLQAPEAPAIADAATTLETIGQVWDDADIVTRHGFLCQVFRAIRVDLGADKLICVEPHGEFAPLFRLDGLEERDGRFYVKEAPAPTGGGGAAACA